MPPTPNPLMPARRGAGPRGQGCTEAGTARREPSIRMCGLSDLKWACGGIAPETVAFGTEAIVFEAKLPNQVVLGPGDIAQAHTVGEFIDVAQLEQAVGVYQRLIERACG